MRQKIGHCSCFRNDADDFAALDLERNIFQRPNQIVVGTRKRWNLRTFKRRNDHVADCVVAMLQMPDAVALT